VTQPTALAEWRKNWPMVLAATVGMSLFSMSTATFGVMMVPIESELGWSRTEISFGPMLISIMVILCATLYGAAIDRFGPRPVALLGVVGVSTGYALASLIGTEIWQWWAVWAVIGLFSATTPAVWVSAINLSFSAGRGLAMAIVLSGSGISSTIGPIVANSLVEQFDWRQAYLTIAIVWFAASFILTLLFLRPPRAAGQQAGTETRNEGAADALPGLTAREGFRSPVFYKLLAATVIANCAGIAMILNVVPILQSTGLTAATAAGVAGFVGVSTIVGRIVSGGLMDRFKATWIAVSAAALMAALPAMLLLFPGNIPASITGIVIYGVMGGAMMPCVAYLASKYLGQRAFGTLYATIMATMSIGIGLGPVLANMVYDAVQSYDPVLIGVIPLFLIGAALYATLGPYPQFEPSRGESR